MMVRELEAVTKEVDRAKARLDNLHRRYLELFNHAYQSEESNPVQREHAKSSIISVWNEI